MVNKGLSPMMPHGDVLDLLRKDGWAPIDLAEKLWVKDGSYFELSEASLGLIDFTFMRGCRWGVGRGAYEQQVQEDVEAGDMDTTQTEEKCPKCLAYYTEGIGGNLKK